MTGTTKMYCRKKENIGRFSVNRDFFIKPIHRLCLLILTAFIKVPTSLAYNGSQVHSITTPQPTYHRRLIL